MNFPFHKWPRPAFAGLCFLALLLSATARAQQADTSGKTPVEILPSVGTRLEYITTDSGAINKLINNVALKQGDNFMYCDSAYIDLAKNNVYAFGNVRLVQTSGTEVQSDYLRYTGNLKIAYLKGNVTLTDGKNNLWSEELEYNLNTKLGVYAQGGTLQSEATTLSSNAGTYNARTKDARFTGEVYVTDPQYHVTSQDLGYNTETKVVRFLAPSVVVNDKSTLNTSSGTWDAKNEIAHFTARSSIENEAQYIEGDKLDYNRKTGFGVATGNVIAIDTNQKATLYCGYAQYNERTKQLWATIKPVMKRVNGNDSLYIRADTFYAAPVPDSPGTKPAFQKPETKMVTSTTVEFKSTPASNKRKNNTETPTAELPEPTADTAIADSTRPRYFIGYHHVLIFSDSMQARCDSISYSQSDSTMRLMYNPIAWSRNSQITGDTILLYTDSSTIKKLFVPNNSFVVSQSGPEKAKMFDQVQGKTLTGFFKDNALHHLVVFPNAETIYYSKDDAGAYLGMNQAQSERMRVFFDSSEVSKIVLEQDVKQTMTPLRQVNIEAARLSRFRWHPEKRPRSIQELFLYEPETKPIPQQNTTTPPAKQEAPETPKTKNRKRRER